MPHGQQAGTRGIHGAASAGPLETNCRRLGILPAPTLTEIHRMTAPIHDLAHVRETLLARRHALRDRHERVAADLQRRGEPLAGDWSDRAIQLQNDEALQAIDEAAQDELEAIEEALQRLGRGLYGICKKCGEPIESGRLQALNAVTCAACASD